MHTPWIFYSAGIVLIVTSVLVAIAHRVVHVMADYPRDTNVTYGLDGMTYEEVVYPSAKGNNSLRGTFFPAANGTTADTTIVIVHGYTSNRMVKGRTQRLVKRLTAVGYNVFAFDLSGQGASDGDRISMGVREKYDVIGTIDYLKSRGCVANQLALIGFSMGAAISIIVACEDLRVDAVVADSPFRNAKLHIRERIAFLSGLPFLPFGLLVPLVAKLFYRMDLGKVSPMSAVKHSVGRPILLIHGTGDTQIPWTNSQKIYLAMKHNRNAFAWYPSNTEHIDAINHFPGEYFDRVQSFLAEYV